MYYFSESKEIYELLVIHCSSESIEAAYTNNEINSEKITKPIRVFQLSLGGNIS